MTIAFGSDDRNTLTHAIADWLRARGDEVVLFGALADTEEHNWASIARSVGEKVATGKAAFGILCCWTGTGVSIAANKVPGIRAALCGDARTAAGARTWNDANVLCISLRATSPAIAQEMLAAWFETRPTTDPEYLAMIADVETP